MRNEWQPFTKIDGRIVELIIIYIAQVLDQEETDLSQNVSKASRRKTVAYFHKVENKSLLMCLKQF